MMPMMCRIVKHIHHGSVVATDAETFIYLGVEGLEMMCGGRLIW